MDVETYKVLFGIAGFIIFTMVTWLWVLFLRSQDQHAKTAEQLRERQHELANRVQGVETRQAVADANLGHVLDSLRRMENTLGDIFRELKGKADKQTRESA